ncbi:MAG TPA: vitamin K epoxide reductase family protein [Rubrobacter sp.]|nr:vitamin K epoxide reductase family protein [Rubrobacter sp.]
MAPSVRSGRRYTAPRVALLALAVVGVLISAYLTWTHFAGLTPVCTGSGEGCQTVQSSRYASLLGIPVAVLGLVAYGGLVFSVAVWAEIGIFLSFLISLVGTLFSVYLTYLEVFIIGALCQWCLASAVIMVAALVCATLAVLPLLRAR